MIAQISQQDNANELINSYIDKLKSSGFTGDLDTSYATRIVNSTDNSIYQEVPQAVVFPKSNKDIQIALQTANQDPFLSLTFGPRGEAQALMGNHLHPELF